MTYLRALHTSIKTLGGVGPASAKAYGELGINTYSDLLLFSPRAWEDRSRVRPLGGIQDGEMANTLVEVLAHSYFGQMSAKKRTLKILLRDVSGEGDGRLSLLCFGRNFLEKSIRVGHIYYIYAQVSSNRGSCRAPSSNSIPQPRMGAFPPPLEASFPSTHCVAPSPSALSGPMSRRCSIRWRPLKRSFPTPCEQNTP